ncbi:MAG TPA: exopolyphosphatase, partial [Clostridium sp.]
LKFFKVICRNNDVEEYIVVATEAIRRSKNQKTILDIVKEKIGLNIRILSGEEESIYGYIAVKCTIDLDNALLIDIGGSSMEISLIKDGNAENVVSLPFGSIPLTKKFPFKSAATTEEKLELKEFLYNQFDKLPWLKKGIHFPIIGIGGASRAIGKIQNKSIDYPLDVLHNYSISKDDVEAVFEKITSLDLTDKYKVKGLPRERADIFTAPLGTINALMSYCKSNEFIISQYGLREGVIYERVLGKNIKNLNILNYSIKRIITNQGLNKEHSEKIWELCALLSNKLELTSWEKKLLKVAAKLHDIGVNVSIKHNYKHSFYMILNSEICGLTHIEILMVSYIIALNGKLDMKLSLDYKSLISKGYFLLCKKLSLLLVISSNLDRYFYDNLKDIEISNNSKSLRIMLPSSSVEYIEDYSGSDVKTAFKKSFGKDLIIT